MVRVTGAAAIAGVPGGVALGSPGATEVIVKVPSALRMKSKAELTPTLGATTSKDPLFEFGGSAAATSPAFAALPVVVTAPK
jgi:hypothetical protein